MKLQSQTGTGGSERRPPNSRGFVGDPLAFVPTEEQSDFFDAMQEMQQKALTHYEADPRPFMKAKGRPWAAFCWAGARLACHVPNTSNA